MKIFIASIKPYSRYRSGQPWAGVVVRKEEFHAAESRYSVDMHAGLFEGSAEQGGRLYVEAEPGDVVAWGQQGIRYNDTGERHGRVRPDGSVETLPDKAAAYRLLDEMAAEAKLAADRPETPVQPVVPEETAPEPEPQAASENQHAEPVRRAVRLAGFAKPMGDPGAEPEYENVVNPFGHD